MSFASGGAVSFELTYGRSPIMMTGGMASALPGATLPVTSLLQALVASTGLLSSAGAASLDDIFGYFQPMPGGTLIEQQVAMYPFANKQTAGNATIQQPLALSMVFICPAGAGAGYLTRQGLITALRNSFYQHNVAGGYTTF